MRASRTRRVAADNDENATTGPVAAVTTAAAKTIATKVAPSATGAAAPAPTTAALSLLPLAPVADWASESDEWFGRHMVPATAPLATAAVNAGKAAGSSKGSTSYTGKRIMLGRRQSLPGSNSGAAGAAASAYRL